jgi:aryl-alcohol dehydrogenase-like predicted oxidoreductase
MRYRVFGSSGLRISELCLGTMTFGETWGWGSSKQEAKDVFDAFANAGGNLIDTANQYTEGDSERWVGEFIHSEREKFVLATKYSMATSTEYVGGSGNSRKHMLESVNASLKRLNTDYIDIYWVHCWDFLTPVEEVMRGLDDLVRSGKVNYVGISNTPAWVIAQCNTLARERGWTPFNAMQLKYNLLVRDIEAEFLPMARDMDLSIFAWSPLANGVLSGKYNAQNTETSEDSKRSSLMAGRVPAHQFAVVDAVREVANQLSASPAQIALAWLRSRDPRIIPVLGARTVQQMENNLACLDIQLTAESLDKLNQAAAFHLPYPHDYLISPMQLHRAYGNYFSCIDNHRPNRLIV